MVSNIQWAWIQSAQTAALAAVVMFWVLATNGTERPAEQPLERYNVVVYSGGKAVWQRTYDSPVPAVNFPIKLPDGVQIYGGTVMLIPVDDR